MKTRTSDTSLFYAVLHRYQRWGSQVSVYFTTIVLTTSTALVLDLRFHWQSERVLLYILPLTVLLLVVLPTLAVVWKRADWKRDHDLKPRAQNRGSLTVFDGATTMMNPAKALALQFVRRTPMTLLVVGTAISLVDLGALYAAAAKEGVLHIGGMGLLDSYGLYSSILFNAVSLYFAKKYYNSVCSIVTIKAIVQPEPVSKSISMLSNMVKLRGKYGFLIYALITFGALAWLSNVATYTVGNPEIRWGYKVFDSLDHPLTFSASRLHNFYSWLIIMPLVGHVMIYSSLQLKQAIAIASREGALKYDLLSPDRRGGFGFLRKAQIALSVITGLLYVQILLHNLDKLLKGTPETVTAYIVFTVLLIWINGGLFGDIYGEIKKLRFESLDKIKDDVYKNDKLSFEILKYCYERRVNWYSIVSIIIQAAAILLAGIGKLGPISETIYRSLRK